jgi:cellulose synthase/poly-beta-1,6-N-acetylglucosamine synthase-like glycosyltransferase
MEFSAATEIVFWISTSLLLYTYAGYVLLLIMVSQLRSRRVKRDDCTPTVSIVIAAYNEQGDLPAKLENTLALDYPHDKVEVIVASDGSTDRTDDIAREFASRGVRLCRQAERLGKTAAQNAAVEVARGEIVLFSDATTLYQPNVLRSIVSNFADPSVGCVGGQLSYVDRSGSDVGRGIRAYWSCETFLKKCESRIGSLIGVSGCLYAVRRSCYVPLNHEACSDFIIATKMVEQGLRAVYEPEALCIEETNRRTSNEFRMRVRVTTRTLGDLWRHRAMMNPLRSGFFAVQLISHKVLRYLVPLLLLQCLLASLLLASGSSFYAGALVVQGCLYAAAALGWLLNWLGARASMLAIPYYFVLANLAALVALCKFLSGERYVYWEPTRESTEAKAASHG